MGMRKSTRQELRKLREIVRECLDGKNCFFCHKPLLRTPNYHGHGDGEGSPINTDLALHHKDGNHSNNEKSNRKWSHRPCHKRHHMKLRWREKRRTERRAA